MSTIVLTSTNGDGELRIDPTPQPGVLDVSVDAGGLHARALIEAGASGGWRSSASVLVSRPEQSLDDLCEYLIEHRDGWATEEVWQSRDGNLSLGFSHRIDHIRVSVRLKRHGDAAWVASTHVALGLGEVGALVSRLRELFPVPV